MENKNVARGLSPARTPAGDKPPRYRFRLLAGTIVKMQKDQHEGHLEGITIGQAVPRGAAHRRLRMQYESLHGCLANHITVRASRQRPAGRTGPGKGRLSIGLLRIGGALML